MSKQKAIRTLPDVSADSGRFIEDLQKETDRGAVLAAGAFLDEALDLMLRAFFVDNPEAVEKLLGRERPLSTFAARTHLAYCLGLLGPEMYADINLIRDLRNDFAHSHHPIDFGEVSVRDKCARLKAWRIMGPDWSLSTRDQFIISAVMVMQKVLVRGIGLQHTKLGEDFKLVQQL